MSATPAVTAINATLPPKSDRLNDTVSRLVAEGPPAEEVGLAPFARTRLGHPPAAVTLLVSAGTEHGDYGDPLLGPDPTPVAHAIADHLATLTRHNTIINLRRLRDDGPTLATIEARDDIAQTPMGQIAYGIGCGLLTVALRYFGSYVEGVSYAILIMNCCVGFFDKLGIPKRFGLVKKAKKGGEGK